MLPSTPIVAAALTFSGTSEARSTRPLDLLQRAKARASLEILPRYGDFDLQVRDSTPQYLTDKTAAYAVNNTGIPEVAFDAGESYAGILPVDVGGNSSSPNQLFFWFWPSKNPAATDEIVIWLNGGPGCSSMDGLLQEHGPFLWQPGTYSPQPNPFSWNKLSNMVYVDQPIGTGLSQAGKGEPARIKDENDVARDFAGFWKNFIDTFDLQGRKVYITGESYAGYYVPYIAQHFIQLNDSAYYNVSGIMLVDPAIGDDGAQTQAPAAAFLQKNFNLFNLNESTVASVNNKSEACGYTDFMMRALTFPPAGKFAAPRDDDDCDVWSDIIYAVLFINPCFNVYHATTYCPYLSNQLGFPDISWGPNNYFNRSDVQTALNVPKTDYSVCGNPTLGLESSPPSSWEALPFVIEHTNNVVVANGNLDFLLLSEGVLASLNNMTWNGAQGFTQEPTDKFFVPYNPTIAIAFANPGEIEPGYIGGGGNFGITHTERGLTWVAVDLAGHMIPQYAPGAGYRHLEKLLGRINSLAEVGNFTYF